MNKYIQLLLLVSFFASSSLCHAAITDDLSRDAYIYAYSMDEAYKQFYETTVNADYPLNRFQNIRVLADDSYTAHPTINNDTLHLMGWLDVAAEPVIVSVPDTDEERYWMLHTMDLAHYTNAMIGSRIRGNKGGQFMFASKSWQGDVPETVDEVISVDTNIIKLMGRIMAAGSEDTKIAQSVMDQWNIRTLSEYVGQNGPKPMVRTYPDPNNCSWLERVNFVLCDGSLGETDKDWLEKYKQIGLEPCKTTFTSEQLAAAQTGRKRGLKQIQELAPTVTDARLVLGTRDILGDGDRVLFSVGTLMGQWGLPPAEAAYRKAQADNNGKPLDGNNQYTMRFKAPDVSEFWSVTVYAADNMLMAANPLNRHSRGDRTLTPDDQGYYSVMLSSDSNKYGEKENFLPVPDKEFYLIMRLYGPSEEIQSGKYEMPTVIKIIAENF